jgi:hypothetical protein
MRDCRVPHFDQACIPNPEPFPESRFPTLPSAMPAKPSKNSSAKPAETRIREDGAAFVLPRFDSLPATAGLNNTEAFRLSIRHALALLPALLAKGMDERPGHDYPDRFSID